MWNLLEVTWANSVLWILEMVPGSLPACWSGRNFLKHCINKNGYIGCSWPYKGKKIFLLYCIFLFLLLPLQAHVAVWQDGDCARRCRCYTTQQSESFTILVKSVLKSEENLSIGLKHRAFTFHFAPEANLDTSSPHSWSVPGLPIFGTAETPGRAGVRDHQFHPCTAPSCYQKVLACPDNPLLFDVIEEKCCVYLLLI